MTVEYDKITKVFETENLVILMLGKQEIMLLKSGFNVGTFSDFKMFIQDKIGAEKTIV